MPPILGLTLVEVLDGASNNGMSSEVAFLRPVDALPEMNSDISTTHFLCLGAFADFDDAARFNFNSN